MPIDHVLYAVSDFAAATARLRAEHGLGSVEGGRHARWGTANWIVPLGRDYIELVSVADPEAAASTLYGRRVTEVIAAGGGLYAWCVAPRQFDATVARLGLAVDPGSRQRPDGTTVAWRAAGVEVAMADPSRPFFIHWETPPDLHPSRATAPHSVRPEGIAWVEVAGDDAAIRDWLGDEELPIRVRPGTPALRAVGISTSAGEIVLR